MGLKKFFKKAAKIALPAAAAYFGGGGSLLSSAFGAVGGASSGRTPGFNPDPNAVTLPRVQVEGDSGPNWFSQNAGALLQGGLSFAGQAMANTANAKQAQQQMDFQRQMSNTSYQRGTADMEAAGLNPMLAYSQGGASSPSGASATIQDAVTPAVSSARAAQTQKLALEQLAISNDNLEKTGASIDANTLNTQANTANALLDAKSKALGPEQMRAQISSLVASGKLSMAQAKRVLDLLPSDLSSGQGVAKQQQAKGNAAEVLGAPFTFGDSILNSLPDIRGSVNSAADWAKAQFRSQKQIVDTAQARSTINQRRRGQ
ncbi:MAG: DNA pilot protein [Microvirus sp.]|nr:MAG: DNA pilot protein [Microvirus sp.]